MILSPLYRWGNSVRLPPCFTLFSLCLWNSRHLTPFLTNVGIPWDWLKRSYLLYSVEFHPFSSSITTHNSQIFSLIKTSLPSNPPVCMRLAELSVYLLCLIELSAFPSHLTALHPPTCLSHQPQQQTDTTILNLIVSLQYKFYHSSNLTDTRS